MRIFALMLAACGAFAAKTAPLAIKSSQLEIAFDPLKGLPVEYRLGPKAALRGGVSGEVGVTIFHSARYTHYAVRPEVIRATKSRADFQFTVREKGTPMASFLLRYDLNGAALEVSLEAVLEEGGFELISVDLPDLVEASDQDAGAWLASGDGGGVLVALKSAKDGRFGASFNIAMLGANRVVAVEEVITPSDTVELSVEKRAARLGTTKIWRTRGDAGNKLIGGRPLNRIEFSGDIDRNGTVDWLDGAKLVRTRRPPNPNPQSTATLYYEIEPGADAAKVAQRVRALTGGAQASTNGPRAPRYDDPGAESGEAIPLVATIDRKSEVWGLTGERWKEHPELTVFFYNARPIPVLGGEDWERTFTAFYYGIFVPWQRIYDRNIDTYLRDGDRVVMGLEGNSRIDLDWKTDQYSIAVGGEEIARDGDTVCPIGDDRVAFYSHAAKIFSAPIPAGWDASAVVGYALFADKREKVPVTVRDGKLTVSVTPERPVMVYRDARAVR
jgi:hypothetical protein